MSDLRPFLDREARGIRPTHDALDSIVRQVDRRRGIRRVAAGAVALALAGGGIGLAYAAFSPDRDVRPAGPAPGPTPSPNPAPSPEGEAPSAPLRIEIRSGVGEPAAGDAASALISGLGGVGGRVFQPTWEGEQAREPSPTTTIHCPPTLDHVAAELRAALFPDARIGPLLPGGSFDLRVVIGEDWVDSNPDAVSAARIVGDFMTARHVDRGAERYLSDDAADEYRTGHGGLSLYGYTGADERSQHAITAMYPSEDRSFVVVVGSRTATRIPLGTRR
jgi:hypothetical protein